MYAKISFIANNNIAKKKLSSRVDVDGDGGVFVESVAGRSAARCDIYMRSTHGI